MDTKKKYLTVLLIFCVSIALFFVLILLRRIHVEQFDITFLLPAIAYYILTILLLRRYGNKLSKTLIILSVLAGATVVEIPLRIIDFHETLLSFPDFIGKIIAIMAALLTFVCRKTSWKVVVACLYFSFCIWYAFFGYIYYFRIISWGTFTGKVDEHVEVLFTPFNDEGTEIDLKDIEAEYILLDAWNSGCNVCFKKFPAVQIVYDKFKEDDRIAVFGLHCFGKDETASTGRTIFDSREYTFPNLSVGRDNFVLKELSVNGFPTILIFDRNRALIFRGDIETAEKFLNETLTVN